MDVMFGIHGATRRGNATHHLSIVIYPLSTGRVRVVRRATICDPMIESWWHEQR